MTPPRDMAIDVPSTWFAERLAAHLKRHRITQTELARRLGCQRDQVNCWVSGRVEPKASTLIKIIRALQTTPNALLGTKP